MNKEQQYRTGRWPEPEAIGHCVLERLSEVVYEHRDRVDSAARARALMAEICAPDPTAATARALLRLDEAGAGVGLVALTEARIAEQPELEAQLWEAMWAVRRVSALEQEYRHLLPNIAAEYELLQQCRDAGWPTSWPSMFCAFWAELGGAPATARARAQAGWTMEQVLTEHVVIDGRVPDLAARLNARRPPLRARDNGRTAMVPPRARSSFSSQGGNR